MRPTDKVASPGLGLIGRCTTNHPISSTAMGLW